MNRFSDQSSGLIPDESLELARLIGSLGAPRDARPSLHSFWHSAHMLAIAVWAFEFELIVQQRQQIRIPTFPRHPSAVQKLPVNQRASALNDIDLTLDKTNRNKFVQHKQVWSRF